MKLQNLGLCRKAGALVMGFDAVVEVVKKNKAVGILVTSDISAKTLKEIKFHAEKNNTEIVHMSAEMEEVGAVLGKSVAVLAITDEGLFNICK